MIFLLVPISNFSNIYGQTEFDSEALGLQMPTITMNPISGQPGTEDRESELASSLQHKES